jgi:transposase InsO family protein
MIMQKVESFIKTLKYEEVYLFDYRTIQEARQRINYFIGEVYNEDRLPYALGYLSLVEFEEKFLAAGKAKPVVSFWGADQSVT